MYACTPRQLVEQRGYWRPAPADGAGWAFVRLERVSLAAACNPPGAAGRAPLPPRFLRHAPLLRVGAPSAAAPSAPHARPAPRRRT